MMINPAERAFSDPSSFVAYEDCEFFVQSSLNMLPHGEFKPWAAGFEPPLNYNFLVSLRNGKAPKAAPNVIQRILTSFGYETKIINRLLATGKRGAYFQFQNAEKLTEFQERLKIFRKQ
jgi:hypothetical protein